MIPLEKVTISYLSISPIIRREIIDLILSIQRDEYALPLTHEIYDILKAEEDFFYNGVCNFWYATNEKKEVIGSIALRKLDDKAGEIKKFFVHKNYRGKGVAQKLMHVLIQAALKYHFEHFYLESARVLKPAHRFYEKYGFVEIEQKEFPDTFKPYCLDNYFFTARVDSLSMVTHFSQMP